jgi:YlmC/YmxH family sporulation protein
MRSSELEGKEVIELTTGERWGVIKESELLINTGTGKVEAIVLRQSNVFGKTGRTIPWNKIRKISEQLIIGEEADPGATKQA